MSNTPVGSTTLPFDISKIPEDLQEMYEKPEEYYKTAGVGGDNLPELNPAHNTYSYEVCHRGKHDATIVLGRDRAGYLGSHGGYGINGHTGCAAIDMVVGRHAAAENVDFKNQKLNPDFATDAARIYISQKSDIDNHLNLPPGNGGISIARSAVALKADGVRIVARENLKLVVGTDQKNALGGNIITTTGVDLIAGKIEDGNRVMTIADNAEAQIEEISEGGMQPIPLGINTAFALDQIVEKVDKLSGIVSTYAMIMNSFLNASADHAHMNKVNDYFGIPTEMSIDYSLVASQAVVSVLQYTVADIKMFRTELVTFKEMHLKPYGAYYINSKYHNLN